MRFGSTFIPAFGAPGSRRAASAVAAALAALGTCAPQAATAQEAAAPAPPKPTPKATHAAAPDAGQSVTLETIVVTAQKRLERLQDVPASISAMTADALEQRGITGVQSLMQGDIPSVRVEPFAGNASVLQVGMRGFINPNGTDITNENPVPIYIDDVYFGRQNAIALELNDLERLEVLRGPQGTLFGKNAEGGALRLVSKKPSGVLGGEIKAEVGNYKYRKAVGHLNLPEVAGVSAKVDLLSTSNDGWTKNPGVDQYNFGVNRASGAKLTLLYEPTDKLTLEYAGDYTDLRTTQAFNAQISSTDPYTNGIWPNTTSNPSSEPYPVYRPLDMQRYWGHRINADFEVDKHLTIRSITAYRQDNATLYNTASTSAVYPGIFFGGSACASAPLPDICTSALTSPVPKYVYTHRQSSEELQFIGKYDKWDWVAGLFYIKESGSQIENTYFSTMVTGVVNPANAATGFLPYTAATGAVVLSPPLGPVATAGAVVDENSKAIFGQATYRPDDQWVLTAGLRFGKDEKSAQRPAIGGAVYSNPVSINPGTGALTPASTAVYPCPASPQCNPSVSSSHVSPMLSASYKLAPDVSTYARYATGYQGDGISVGSQLFKYYKPSKVDSYELGFKSEFDQRKVRVNVAAFYANWKNPQENIQTVSSSTVEFFSGSTIKIQGLELDAAWKPISSLTLNAALSLMHGTQGDMDNPYGAAITAAGVPVVPAKFHLVNVPKWAASIAVNYDFVHTAYGIGRVSLQTNGTASYYSVPNVSIPVASYWLLDGRLALTEIPVGGHGRLELALWGKNLANKSYNTFVYAAPGLAGTNTDGSFGTPRTFGAALSYKFD